MILICCSVCVLGFCLRSQGPEWPRTGFLTPALTLVNSAADGRRDQRDKLRPSSLNFWRTFTLARAAPPLSQRRARIMHTRLLADCPHQLGGVQPLGAGRCRPSESHAQKARSNCLATGPSRRHRWSRRSLSSVSAAWAWAAATTLTSRFPLAARDRHEHHLRPRLAGPTSRTVRTSTVFTWETEAKPRPDIRGSCTIGKEPDEDANGSGRLRVVGLVGPPPATWCHDCAAAPHPWRRSTASG